MKSWQACLADARAKREDRNRRSLKQLREAGIAVTDEDLKELGEGRVLTRGNLAELLVKKGYAQSVKEAWNQYMKRGQGRLCLPEASDSGGMYPCAACGRSACFCSAYESD